MKVKPIEKEIREIQIAFFILTNLLGLIVALLIIIKSTLFTVLIIPVIIFDIVCLRKLDKRITMLQIKQEKGRKYLVKVKRGKEYE